MSGNDENTTSCIVDIVLDEKTVVRRGPEVEHERRVAVYDLLEENNFSLMEGGEGPYSLHLSIEENRLVFDVRHHEEGDTLRRILLSLTPFRRLIKDYFMVCENYYDAIRTAAPGRIEAIDVGRRALHDEGSRLLIDRLFGKVEVDFDTSRRLFTLICVLHIRG
ncbi:MAG: UPF0262 family protein [Parvularculales bacterium]